MAKRLMGSLCDKANAKIANDNVTKWNATHPLWAVRYPKTKKEILDCAYQFEYYIEELLEYGADEFGYVSWCDYIKRIKEQ